MERGVLPIGDWSMAMTLSRFSRPSIPSWSPAMILALFRLLARCLYRISLTRELLPEPDTPDLHIDIAEVVDAGAAHLDPARGLSALLRDRDRLSAAQVLACDGGRIGHDLLGRARRHDFTAVGAGAGTDVDDIVRRHHSVLIVFHDNDGVPQVAQTLEGPQQLVVVPLVKSDTGLVQDVADADQARTDLGRQTDPLRLAA